MAKKETVLKNWLCNKWEASGGWCERYEPARGSGVGYPDVQLLVEQLIPVELKIIESIRNGYMYSEEVRGSQIGWHTRLNKWGQKSFFLWATIQGNSPINMYMATVKEAEKWRLGIPLNDLIYFDVKDKSCMNNLRLCIRTGRCNHIGL